MSQTLTVAKGAPGPAGLVGPIGPTGPMGLTGACVLSNNCLSLQNTLDPLFDEVIEPGPFLSFCTDENCFKLWGCINYTGTVASLVTQEYLSVDFDTTVIGFPPAEFASSQVDPNCSLGIWTTCVEFDPSDSQAPKFSFSGKIFLEHAPQDDRLTLVFKTCFWFPVTIPVDPAPMVGPFSFKICGQLVVPAPPGSPSA